MLCKTAPFVKPFQPLENDWPQKSAERAKVPTLGKVQPQMARIKTVVPMFGKAEGNLLILNFMVTDPFSGSGHYPIVF